MGLEEELKKCVHCGFCLEACPTYVVTRSEVHSPRGRITAVKLNILSEGINTCMYCRRCELACPSGVIYSEIITRVRKPNTIQKVMLRLLERPHILPYFIRGEYAKKIPVKAEKPIEYRDNNEEIILFPGCITSIFFKETVQKTLNYLKSLGYRVKIYNGCCGLAHKNAGELNRSKELIEKLRKEFHGRTIVSLSSNCSAHMKENGLEVYDFPEFIIKFNLPLPKVERRLTIHEPCHANILGLNKYTREVLSKMGVEISESEEPSFECGAGGDYFLFHEEISEKVMQVKKEKTLKSGVNTVVSTNPSCSLAFIKMGLKPIHIADLL
ncbi:(Fe-S)-binding protein [Sulfurisphaera tokodaii]|uniref:Glycolate oxidase iron-sulfur subunit n=2 Tax=Sulfurisphaera tokodaii TaxID=111955 RepID=Q96Y72_SULTO|nr:(Fe-S)-binding protein [Sulfurisphaera tokodaii]BAB67405.1 putative glycolate oxidase iron-sulfur subunit [Sulfurisphaera tokodaii str. 7]HII75117.1 (Fe-S)-binding protein [Sulfurisphaera tokodaii]